MILTPSEAFRILSAPRSFRGADQLRALLRQSANGFELDIESHQELLPDLDALLGYCKKEE